MTICWKTKAYVKKVLLETAGISPNTGYQLLRGDMRKTKVLVFLQAYNETLRQKIAGADIITVYALNAKYGN